ncbi:MAG: hypothetical protein Tsb0021_15580 [Chlamydiales bacterium]
MKKSVTFFSAQSFASVPWLVIGKVGTFVLYFIISILIVRFLSPEEYGIYRLLSSISEYLVVPCSLGLNFALLRFIPELATQKKIDQIRDLLRRIVGYEVIAWAAVALILFFLRGWLGSIFDIKFDIYFIPVVFLLGALVAKEFMNNSLTAFYFSKTLMVFSLIQAFFLLTGLLLLKYVEVLSIGQILILYASSILIVSIFSSFKLKKQLEKHGLNNGKISRSRLFGLSLPVMVNNLANRLLEQYSEIFFLGFLTTPALVGFFALGAYLPQLAINFFPLTLHTLFTSAFSESYAKDEECLPHLMKGMYQMLIFIALPMAAYGLFNSPELIVMIYGIKMAAAGPVASFFSAFSLLPLIWIPLSMAITAKELVKKTVWMSFLPLMVNLPLDYIFIKYFGLNGAMMAIATTYFLTMPMKLGYLYNLLGTLSFPLLFFLKIAAVSLTCAAFVRMWVPTVSPTLFAVSLLLYISLGFLFIKFLPIVKKEDILHFESIGSASFNRFLNFVVK